MTLWIVGSSTSDGCFLGNCYVPCCATLKAVVVSCTDWTDNQNTEKKKKIWKQKESAFGFPTLEMRKENHFKMQRSLLFYGNITLPPTWKSGDNTNEQKIAPCVSALGNVGCVSFNLNKLCAKYCVGELNTSTGVEN